MILSRNVCLALSLIIYQEEQIFRKSLAFSAGLKYPVPPEATDDQAVLDKALEKYDKQKDSYWIKREKPVGTMKRQF